MLKIKRKIDKSNSFISFILINPQKHFRIICINIINIAVIRGRLSLHQKSIL